MVQQRVPQESSGPVSPSSGSRVAEVDVTSLISGADTASVTADVTDPSYVYLYDRGNSQYVALDLSDPANPAVADTLATADGTDNYQHVPHSNGEWLYGSGFQAAIELPSPGSFWVDFLSRV